MMTRKLIVLVTTAVGCMVVGGLAVVHCLQGPPPIQISTSGFPMFGSPGAKVELVVFEDFRCEGCHEFNRNIYPAIDANYIEPGKARYVVIPLAFLENSRVRANAAWAVYKQNPEKFLTYVKELFLLRSDDAIDRNTLLYLAKAVGGVNLNQLAACLDSGCYYEILENNMDLARKVMGSDFRTPALYVNGVRTSTRSFEAIRSQIDEILK